MTPPIFKGWQETLTGRPMPLFNLTEKLGVHPVGSTVSGQTLVDEGAFTQEQVDMLTGPSTNLCPHCGSTDLAMSTFGGQFPVRYTHCNKCNFMWGGK